MKGTTVFLIVIGICICFCCLSISTTGGLWYGSTADDNLSGGLNVTRKTCHILPGTRLQGGGFLIIDEKDKSKDVEPKSYRNYTLEQCKLTCENDRDCKQFVYYEPEKYCYTYKKDFLKCAKHPDFTSGYCSDRDPMDSCFEHKLRGRAFFAGMKRYCNDKPNLRLWGGGFKDGDASDILKEIPLVKDTAACKQECVDEGKCLQYVFDKVKKKCILFANDYQSCERNDDFDSGFCGIDPSTKCTEICPDGFTKDFQTKKCVERCEKGQERNPQTKECVDACPTKQALFRDLNKNPSYANIKHGHDWAKGGRCIPNCTSANKDGFIFVYNADQDSCDLLTTDG